MRWPWRNFHCSAAAKGRESPPWAWIVGDIASRDCALTAFEAIARPEGPQRPMTQLPIDRLRAQIAADELEADAAQIEVAALLDALARQLNNWRPRRGALLSLFSRS